LRISMASVGLSLLIVNGTSPSERRMLQKLVSISVVNKTILRLLFDGTGMQGLWQGRRWLYATRHS
jgi:hypothetical protein